MSLSEVSSIQRKIWFEQSMSNLTELNFDDNRLQCAEHLGRIFVYGTSKTQSLVERVYHWLGIPHTSLAKVRDNFEKFIIQNKECVTGAQDEGYLIRTVRWLNNKIKNHNQKLNFALKAFLTIDEIDEKKHFTFKQTHSSLRKGANIFRQSMGLCTLQKSCLKVVIEKFESHKSHVWKLPSDLQQEIFDKLTNIDNALPLSYILEYLPSVSKIRMFAGYRPCDLNKVFTKHPALRSLSLFNKRTDLSLINANKLYVPRLEHLKLEVAALGLTKKLWDSLSQAAPNLKECTSYHANWIGEGKFKWLSKLIIMDFNNEVSLSKIASIAPNLEELRIGAIAPVEICSLDKLKALTIHKTDLSKEALQKLSLIAPNLEVLQITRGSILSILHSTDQAWSFGKVRLLKISNAAGYYRQRNCSSIFDPIRKSPHFPYLERIQEC